MKLIQVSWIELDMHDDNINKETRQANNQTNYRMVDSLIDIEEYRLTHAHALALVH